MNPLKSVLTALALSVVASIPALAAPTVYTPDPDHTFVRFSYSHLGFTTQQSRFNKTTGSVTLDPVAKTGSVDLVIDTKSVDTGSELFNGHIQAADLFDTADFPTATFKSTSVKFAGDAPTTVSGILTIKGIAQPITLTITSFKHAQNMRKKDAIGADATATVKRSDWKLDKFVPLVSDEVTLNIAIEAAAP
jgi:polyisoprenoid-binding protein YceI